MLSSFAVGAKNTVGIASRNGLDLDMIGSAGGPGAFYVVNTSHFYYSKDINHFNFIVNMNFTISLPVSKNRKGVKTVITCSFFALDTKPAVAYIYG